MQREDEVQAPPPAATAGERADAAGPDGSTPSAAAWARAAGVSDEHVIEDEPAPRLHRALIVLGPLALALAILASLWSSGRRVERSVGVQVETRWLAGRDLALRAQLVGGDLSPVPGEVAVEAALVDAAGERHELGALTPVADGLAQARLEVPDAPPGAAELHLAFVPPDDSGLDAFDERVPVEIVAEPAKRAGKQVISESILQWADDSDAQPVGLRIDLRPDGRLLAGFTNRVFLRVTDAAGRPWRPAIGLARAQVWLISGEFAGELGSEREPALLFDGALDRFGLAAFDGQLNSDVVRFEVRLLGSKDVAALAAGPTEGQGEEAAAPRALSGPKRRLRFVSHAGTVRVSASTNLARPGDVLRLRAEALSGRRPIYVDVHGPEGGWIDSFTPLLAASQAREWVIPEDLAVAADGAFLQFEAYQSVLRPEHSSALAGVQLATAGPGDPSVLAPLLSRQRAQLDLPRVDRQFEIPRERAYLDRVEALAAQGAEAEELERLRAFLLGSLEAVVYGPPQALHTRAREQEQLAAFKWRWTVAIRWVLLGGGALYIALLVAMVVRNQRRLELHSHEALELAGAGASDEAFADQARATVSARRQLLARGLLTVALMVAALLLTVAMLESLVWEY